jgi:hypothetical protein
MMGSSFRPHAFIDYFDHKDAKRAKETLGENDQYGEKRFELGDKNCEINFALKKKKESAMIPAPGT